MNYKMCHKVASLDLRETWNFIEIFEPLKLQLSEVIEGEKIEIEFNLKNRFSLQGIQGFEIKCSSLKM